MTLDKAWQIPKSEGKSIISPLATPFPTKDMRELLDITYRRMVSRGGYGMVAQLRSWLPDEIGGVYWFYVDNQYVSSYVPIYAGVEEIHESYKIYDPDNFDERSARWAIDFVDNLLYLNWQNAIKDLRAVRDPLEQSFFENQPSIEEQAMEKGKKRAGDMNQFLTSYTRECMEKTLTMYQNLQKELISKYTNNNQKL